VSRCLAVVLALVAGSAIVHAEPPTVEDCSSRCAETRRDCLAEARKVNEPCEQRCGTGEAAERCRRGCRERLGKGRRRCRDGFTSCREECTVAETCEARCTRELRDCRSEARAEPCKRRCSTRARRAAVACRGASAEADCRAAVAEGHMSCRRECGAAATTGSCFDAFQACLSGCRRT